MKFKAIVIQDDNDDVTRLLRMGCAEAKKSLATKTHVKPVDFIKRDYGYIIVVELPDKLYEDHSVVRMGNIRNE